jgi:myo-inositol-1(or 4)-monophosphatase
MRDPLLIGKASGRIGTLEWNMRALLEPLLETGRMALAGFGQVKKEWKGDKSIVTEIDRQIEEYWKDFLGPDVPFIGEETIALGSEEEIQKALTEECYILDPIDGTAPFAYGLPNWGISLGYARRGRLTEGLLYFPLSGELFYSQRGQTYLQIIPAASQDIDLTYEPLKRPKDMETNGMLALAQGLAKNGKIPVSNPVQVVGSCIWTMAYVMKGSYLAYMARFKLWDFAAALLLLSQLGLAFDFATGGDPGLDIGKLIYTEAEHPERWKTRTEMIFAQNTKALEYVQEHLVRD